MRIESGPTTERIVRNGLFFLMMAAFGAFFIYDGYRGYPAENFANHLESLDKSEREQARSAPVYESVSPATVDAAEKGVTRLSLNAQRHAIEEVYGGPPSLETPSAIYYFGPDFRMKFPISDGKLRKPIGRPLPHKLTDLRFQKMIGWFLMAVSLGSAAVLLSIVTTRCVLDDTGIDYRLKGRVSWDQMTSLESSRFMKKGWVDLVYAGTGGEKRLRLDEYHLKHFPEIVGEICGRKGWEDPVAKEMALKAQRAADAAAAESTHKS